MLKGITIVRPYLSMALYSDNIVDCKKNSICELSCETRVAKNRLISVWQSASSSNIDSHMNKESRDTSSVLSEF